MTKKPFIRREDGAKLRQAKKGLPVKVEEDEATKIKKLGEEQIALAKKLVVENEIDYINGAEILLKAKELYKKIEDEKAPILKPAKEIIKVTNAKYKPAETVLDQIDEIVRKKVLDHANAMEAKAQEELDALNNKIAKGQLKDPTKIEDKIDRIHSQVPAKTVHTGNGSIQLRQLKKVFIVDASKIPDEYWVVDEAKVKEAILKDGLVVPGADWKFENTLAVI